MRVTTKNSLYSVVGKGDKIHITKVAAINPSSYYRPGQTVITTYCSIAIGKPMTFYDGPTLVATSAVTYVEG